MGFGSFWGSTRGASAVGRREAAIKELWAVGWGGGCVFWPGDGISAVGFRWGAELVRHFVGIL